ncbi:MAG: tryptophan-rich sensory protein [Proteobacteria bacterium]|nr:tryptophan-rich sensory protein [Pseudomonadota bacterium]
MTTKNGLKLMGLIVLFLFIGSLLGLMTKANINPWYDNLTKSALTPPNWVFSVVWSILYVLLAYVAYKLWLSYQTNKKLIGVIFLFAIQLIMNWLWTPFFFQLHWMGFSFIWLMVMIIINAILIYQLKNQQKLLALLLSIYSVWLLFASYLNGFIWFFN